MDRLGAVCLALVRGTWLQLVTLVGFLVAVGLRFPGWFVILSIAVVAAAVSHVGRCLESRGAPALHDPLLGAVLVGSGLASIVLTLKRWFVERQMQLPAGSLLYLAGHSEATTNPTLAWSSVLTQWSSCLIFLAITAIWAIRGGRVDWASRRFFRPRGMHRTGDRMVRERVTSRGRRPAQSSLSFPDALPRRGDMSRNSSARYL